MGDHQAYVALEEDNPAEFDDTRLIFGGGIQMDPAGARSQRTKSRIVSLMDTPGYKISEVQSSSKEIHETGADVVDGVLYSKRWIMLFLYGLANFMMAAFWATFLPFSDTAKEFLNISATEVDLLTQCYHIVCVPSTLLSFWILERKGLRWSILIGSGLSSIGASLRALPFLIPMYPHSQYFFICLGQFINAFAQPFVLNAPAKLSVTWFGPKERVLATTFAWLSNGLGSSTALMIGPFAVPQGHGDHISGFMFVEATIMVSITILVLFVFQAEPPNPPSKVTGDKSRSPALFGGLTQMMKSVPFLVMMVAFGTSFGTISSIATLVDPMLSQFYSEQEAGICASLQMFVGLLTAMGLSFWLKKLNVMKYKLFAIVYFSMAVVCQVWLTFNAEISGAIVALALCWSLYGAALVSLQPLCFEMAAESVFPLSASTSTGVLLVSGNIFALIITYSMRALTNPVTGSLMNGNWLTFGFVVFGLVLMILFKYECKRTIAEEKYGKNDG